MLLKLTSVPVRIRTKGIASRLAVLFFCLTAFLAQALYKAEQANTRLRGEFLLQKQELETKEVRVKAAWFQVGCETAFNNIERESSDEMKQAMLQIGLYSLRMRCAQIAEDLRDQLEIERKIQAASEHPEK